MPDISIAVPSGTGPSFVSAEPSASEPRAAEALMCVDKASEGAEGASNAGSEALVRRFRDASGTGGGSGYVHELADVHDPCAGEKLGALATCGGTALFAAETVGVGALLSGVKCIADLESLAECLSNENEASEP